MNEQEIIKEYYNYLNDTNKENNKKSYNDFKKDFITWYIELFGLYDPRTLEIEKTLNDLQKNICIK